MSEAPALPPQDPAALFRIVGPARRVLIAVSGGPDSMALLRLAARWREAGGPPLHAATVDHGLRPEGRAEAEQTARWAQALDIPHTILTWSGEKPATRLQERAREARYALLERLAAEIGAEVLLTAHHADDQAETILFRLLRGSGVAGLSGMAAVSERGSLRLVRPLLGCSKADLVAFCEAEGQAFVRDPSNEDPRFARTRVRGLMAALAAEGLGRAGWLRLGRRAARIEAAAASACAAFAASLPARREEGLFECEAKPLRQAPEECALRLLEAECVRVGGGAPRLERVESLLAMLFDALSRGEPFRATLAGASVSLSRKGRLCVTKAPPRRHGVAHEAESPELP